MPSRTSSPRRRRKPPRSETSPFSLGRFDDELRARHNARYLVGVDEAGRGPLAGPVLAAAVLLPPSPLRDLSGVRDSKRLSAAAREEQFLRIRACGACVGVGWALPGEIDTRNILQATFLAMRCALGRLSLGGEGILVAVDGNRPVPGLGLPQVTLVAGDARSLSVASAGIVAKVVRDRWMAVLERRHPGYGFARNKGYGTAAHWRALESLGPSPVHRRSFIRRLSQPALL